MFRMTRVLRASKDSLGSLMPAPTKKASPSAPTLPKSRIEAARVRTPIGEYWHSYEKAFIRSGSAMPVVHALSVLMAMQCGVWAIWGMPAAVRDVVTSETSTERTPHIKQRGT